MSIEWEILFIFLLILANGFFAAAEIAILTARRSRLGPEADAGDRAARVALELARDPNRFLPTVQVGITLIGTVAATFGGAHVVGFLAERIKAIPVAALASHAESIALGIVILSITYLSLLFGELVPKRLALRGAERLAKLVSLPMQGLSIVARPLVWVLGISTDAVLTILRSRDAPEVSVSVEDIEHLMQSGSDEGVLDPAELRAATKALRLGDRTVREIMRPRVEIDALDVETPPDEIVGAVVMSGFSRVPVYQGDLDNILGFIYNKDLFLQLHMGWPIDIHKLMRPAPLVPETLRLDQLLDLFRTKRTQMAVILDEYGGTEGLVTMEDVLEELVGEIHDEHRRAEDQTIVRRDEASWSIDGGVRIGDLLEAADLAELRMAAPQEVATVGGLVQSLLGRLPVVGDRAAWHNLVIEVTAMDGLRIDRLLVTRLPKRSADSESR
ncbi:MAG: HlyC/CorC family transporter [Rhodopirellula sp.]|nr:HlyC/CorC family transporter [Rhodopirellula sp.]